MTVQNGTGTTVAKTYYNYDQTAVTATSGTPQHTSAPSSRGNLTSVYYYTQGSTYLTASNTYYDTGNVYVATDVNSGSTTYAYGAGSCGNSFATGITEAISTLTKSITWDCNGGVQTSVKDENSQTTSTTYNDPYFYRPNAITDQLGNQTNIAYVVSGGYEIANGLEPFVK